MHCLKHCKPSYATLEEAWEVIKAAFAGMLLYCSSGYHPHFQGIWLEATYLPAEKHPHALEKIHSTANVI